MESNVCFPRPECTCNHKWIMLVLFAYSMESVMSVFRFLDLYAIVLCAVMNWKHLKFSRVACNALYIVSSFHICLKFISGGVP